MQSHFSCVWLFETLWTVAARLLWPWDFPGKNTGVGCLSYSKGSSWPRGRTCVYGTLKMREGLGWFTKKDLFYSLLKISSVQSLSHVRLFVTPWIAACQASLSITNSRSLLKLMPIESVMPSNHLILCCPLLLLPSIFPSIRVFSNESALASGGQTIGVSASTPDLPVNTRDWSPLGWTGWSSLQSKGLSRVFSNTTVQKHQFFGAHFFL